MQVQIYVTLSNVYAIVFAYTLILSGNMVCTCMDVEGGGGGGGAIPKNQVKRIHTHLHGRGRRHSQAIT